MMKSEMLKTAIIMQGRGLRQEHGETRPIHLPLSAGSTCAVFSSIYFYTPLK